MKSLFLAALFTGAVATTTAMAATIYDESISGDTGAYGFAPYLESLNLGKSSILGDFEAGGPDYTSPDEFDGYVFTTTTTFTVDAFTLSGDEARYYLYTVNSVTAYSYEASSYAGADLFGEIEAGNYYIRLIGKDGQGTGSYQIDINVGPTATVPLPAGGLLLLGALGAATALRRRTRA